MAKMPDTNAATIPTTSGAIPMQLLNPLQIDDGHDPNQQIDVLPDLNVFVRRCAVQPFVEQHVGRLGQIFPLGERAGLLTERRGLVLVVQISAPTSATAVAVSPEQTVELGEQIGVRPEMAELMIAARDRIGHLLLHARTVVAVKAVTFHERGRDGFATKDLLEGSHDRRGAGSGRTRDRNDRMCG